MAALSQAVSGQEHAAQVIDPYLAVAMAVKMPTGQMSQIVCKGCLMPLLALLDVLLPNIKLMLLPVTMQQRNVCALLKQQLWCCCIHDDEPPQHLVARSK